MEKIASIPLFVFFFGTAAFLEKKGIGKYKIRHVTRH